MSFDTLAPQYRNMEALLAGNILQRCRIAFLAEASDCRQALLLGEGPGRFLVELLQANSRVQVTCVERSPQMIQGARREVKRKGLDGERVTFERCDALEWQPPRRVFDLVVTHFFLDCFRCDELGNLIAKVAARATDDARWLLADFPPAGQRLAKVAGESGAGAEVRVLPVRDRSVGVATHASERISGSCRI
jgi:SAM-dependent methyltransferase